MIKKRVADKRLQTLMEMLSCNGSYYLSIKGPSSQSPRIPEEILCLKESFRESGCEAFLRNTAKEGPDTAILWSSYGLMWIGIRSDYEDAENDFLLLGPIRSKEASNEVLEKSLQQLESIRSKIQLQKLVASLPHASYDTVYRLATFLAYSVRGEKLRLSAIAFQHGDALPLSNVTRPAFSLTHDNDHYFFSLIRDKIYKGIVPDDTQLLTQLDGFRFSEPGLPSDRFNAVASVAIAVNAAMDAGLLPARAFQVAEKCLSPMLKEEATAADVSAAVESAFRELAEMVYSVRHRFDATDPIVQCMAYIDANPEEKLDLELLAAQVHYSKYYLTRKFKERTGQSIVDYIQKAKIDRAQILLRTTHMSLSEIASALSLSSASYLNRLLKRYTGQTAAQYRETCREMA